MSSSEVKVGAFALGGAVVLAGIITLWVLSALAKRAMSCALTILR